ncbi:MAG: hypothetical protein PHH85_06525 [Candidatus Methanoperedens sp.]|nr:hypothetical protein [Candidatus Methanoperedens sp.]
MAEIVQKKIAAAAMIIIAALLAVPPSAMALMAEMSIEDLTGQADVIVTGQVKEVESRRGSDRTMIYTYTTLATDRYIKGNAGGTLTIITEGGNVDGYGVRAEDMPEFSKNESVLVFLKKAGREFNVAGLVQGKYIVENGEVRDISGEKVSLKDFLRRVEDAIPKQDALLFDAQGYASNTGVSVEEALRRFQLIDVAGKLGAELSKNETGTFAGLWVEHTPEFKFVVQFTRDSEEIIKPYLKKYPELADIVEMRTANVSLANLQKDQADASSSVNASGIHVQSEIDVHENSVKLYVAKADRSRFDDILQRGEIRLPDTVRVITVEALAEDVRDASSSPAAQASPEAPGFEIVFGIVGVLGVWWRLGERRD